MKSEHTLQEQRQEGDEEHQEDGDDTPADPLKDRDEVVAPSLSTEYLAIGVDLADEQLLVQCAQVQHCTSVRLLPRRSWGPALTGDHENLDGVDDQDVVYVETSVRVVER